MYNSHPSQLDELDNRHSQRCLYKCLHEVRLRCFVMCYLLRLLGQHFKNLHSDLKFLQHQQHCLHEPMRVRSYTVVLLLHCAFEMLLLQHELIHLRDSLQ